MPATDAQCGVDSVTLALEPMVAEGEVEEDRAAPTAHVRFQLVDAVPAHARLERQDILQARPTIRARRAPDGIAASCACAPRRRSRLVGAAAGHAQRVIVGREGGHEALEVVGLHRDVGVELDDDVWRVVARARKPLMDRIDDGAAPVELGRRYRDDADPVELFGEVAYELDVCPSVDTVSTINQAFGARLCVRRQAASRGRFSTSFNTGETSEYVIVATHEVNKVGSSRRRLARMGISRRPNASRMRCGRRLDALLIT